MRDNKQGTCMAIDDEISFRQKCYQERSLEVLKIQGPYNRNSAHVECERKSDTGNNRGDWNHLNTIQTEPEQHTAKARH